MTGAYLRVKREYAWQNVEVEHLTPDERREIFSKRETEELLRWVDLLCKKVVESEKILNELVADGILKVADSNT